MASIRSNWHSVSSTYYDLTALRQRIATCFGKLRVKIGNHSEPQLNNRQHHYKERSFVKNLNHKLQLLLSPTKNQQRFKKRQQCGEKVEIVTKLLSSTLLAGTHITTHTTTRTTTTTATLQCEAELEAEVKDPTAASSERQKMTIVDDTLLTVRYEYPDLDSEVRGILMARAQDGATISQIKEDYRKITGSNFPIYDKITNYLLSIPTVGAVCSPRGTLIFSIVPTEKTKHLYDLVLQQKPLPANNARWPVFDSNGNRSYGASRHALSWRSNIYRRLDYSDANGNYRHDVHYANHESTQTPQVVAKRVVDRMRHSSESDWDEVTTDRNKNSIYQDNCNYLNNRLYKQGNLPTLHGAKIFKKNTDNEKDDHNNNYYQTTSCESGNDIKHLPEKSSNNLIQNYNNRASDIGLKQLMPRPTSRTTASSPTCTRSSGYGDSIYCPMNSDYEAHLLDFLLLGDDFLLYLARMELKCKFKKHHRVLQSGLCVSGQTITAAIGRVRQMEFCQKSVIVNLGSVDIMKGKPLVQIEYDYRELIALIQRKGMTPILTTLAPLANYGHQEQVKEKVERFNAYVRRLNSTIKVIDICQCLVNERGHIRFDCYQNEPRFVTGTPESYVFWNKIGRQRVLQLIESNIEY